MGTLLIMGVACAPDNDPPLIIERPSDVSLATGFGTITVDLTGTFTDPDEDLLSLIVESSNASVVTVTVDRFIVTVTEVGNGEATITATVSDPDGDMVSTNFMVSVN
ncbi:MAG TPA: hypothetical protein DCR93_32895 [Cytophagales bacterium]|nr:hypothetical protein [Cytophagales bacterium]HAP64083.1 hypothetical protein [Cytophagales bacterium]